jgi:hypothetical protein
MSQNHPGEGGSTIKKPRPGSTQEAAAKQEEAGNSVADRGTRLSPYAPHGIRAGRYEWVAAEQRESVSLIVGLVRLTRGVFRLRRVLGLRL